MQSGLSEEWRIMDEIENRENKELENAISLSDPVKLLYSNTPIVIPDNFTIQSALEVLQKKSIGCLMVVSETKLTGIFTERDIVLKLSGKGYDYGKEIVRNYMTTEVETLKAADPVAYALNKMVVGGFRHIPIVDDINVPIGLISVKDVINHLGDYFNKDIINLPLQPPQKGFSKREGG